MVAPTDRNGRHPERVRPIFHLGGVPSARLRRAIPLAVLLAARARGRDPDLTGLVGGVGAGGLPGDLLLLPQGVLSLVLPRSGLVHDRRVAATLRGRDR